MRGPFDVWAPKPERLRLVLGSETLEMRRGADDWWTPVEPTPDVSAGEVDYGYLVDDAETPVPDPRSRRQPDGVHGLSRTFDPTTYAWTDQAWTGRQLAGSMIYELHVGTFTPRARSTRRWGSWTTCAGSAWTSSSCCRSTRSTARTTGATTACSGPPSTSRTAAPRRTSASSTPATRPGSA